MWRFQGMNDISGFYARHLIACNVGILLVVVCAFLKMSWVGYLGSDDAFYLQGAQGILSEFPYLGKNHWELRYPLVLPIAFSIGVFGPSELSLSLPSMIYLAALVILTYLFFRTRAGEGWAMLMALLVAAVPIFSLKFTSASVEAPEVFFSVTSLMAFIKATEDRRFAPWLIVSGVLAGIAFASRETALSLVITYIVLFLIGYGGNRIRYFIVGGAFIVITAIEYAYLWALSGAPLYRLQTDVGHDLVDRQSVVVEGVDAAGNISLGSFVDPFLVIFANQEFGLLFVICAIALATWRFMSNSPSKFPKTATPFLVLAICNFLLIAFLTKSLYLEPRYFAAAAFGAIIVIVMWIRGAEQWHPAQRIGVVFALFASFVGGSLVDNKDYFFAERALVVLASDLDEIIYTDPSTADRAAFLLESKGLAHRVVGERPPDGALYLHVSKNLVQRREAKKWFVASDYMPEHHWEVVKTVDPPNRVIGQLAKGLHVDRLLPSSIRRKLVQPNDPAVLYRTVE